MGRTTHLLADFTMASSNEEAGRQQRLGPTEEPPTDEQVPCTVMQPHLTHACLQA